MRDRRLMLASEVCSRGSNGSTGIISARWI